jgi:hypothetical protein
VNAASLLGTVVDGHALWQVVWSSLVIGIGVTSIFAIAIHGATRAVDASRDGRAAEAVIFGTLAAVSAAAVGLAVVLGIIVMAKK